MAGFDVLVWLSEGEGMPHVLIEAGAAGVPVVATPDVGAADVVADDKTGLLVPHRDPAAVVGRSTECWPIRCSVTDSA